MSPQKRTVESGALEVRFVGDKDVLDHIVEKHEGIKIEKETPFLTLVFSIFVYSSNFIEHLECIIHAAYTNNAYDSTVKQSLSIIPFNHHLIIL